MNRTSQIFVALLEKPQNKSYGSQNDPSDLKMKENLEKPVLSDLNLLEVALKMS